MTANARGNADGVDADRSSHAHDGDSKFRSGNPWAASADTPLFGYFANNNQLLMRATYQF